MINAFAQIQPVVSPQVAQENLETVLQNAGITVFETHLQRVDVTGYYFSVSCEDTEGNLGLMKTLFGELNVVTNQHPLGSPMFAVREVDSPFGPWPVAGGEGKFARQHPTPSWAK